MVAVQLTVRCDSTSPGENVAVCGSWNAWNKSQCPTLDGSAWPKWTGSVEIAADARVEYKYCITRDGEIVRWEDSTRGDNRVLEGDCRKRDDGEFGVIPAPSNGVQAPEQVQSEIVDHGGGDFFLRQADDFGELDSFEEALVKMSSEQTSWRQRLSFIRTAFTDPSFAANVGFKATSQECLVAVSVYLTFLATGQVRCEEDNGHHRPNHHAMEAQRIETALDAAFNDNATENSLCAYVARSIYPQLPSYSSQFTVSVPLTRIRDIAHRGDIPHELKQEIKHTLQNKLHRCAGPEDLVTCERLLDRVSQGGYSHDFVEQMHVFHRELKEFFNASTLDERLRFLSDEPLRVGNLESQVKDTAKVLYKLKHEWKHALAQLDALTELRGYLRSILTAVREEQLDTPPEISQKLRLADIDLDKYAFTLLASIANDVESTKNGVFPWSNALRALCFALRNMAQSHIFPRDCTSAAAEIEAIAPWKISMDAPLQRAKAAVERSLRTTLRFSTEVSEVYMKQVSSLSRELGVEHRAAAVFAEALIRSNVAFQASRLADAIMRRVRRDLGLPPWDPLFAGEASGVVQRVENMSDIKGEDGVDLVVVCRNADGEEDIPISVRAVILGRSLPHLSHLGVRARQASVVFVCAEEPDAFESVWNSLAGQDRYVHVQVSDERGLDSIVDVQENGALSKSKETVSVPQTVKLGAVDLATKQVLPLNMCTKQNSGAKCAAAGRLARLSSRHGGLFLAAEGACLPFGLFWNELKSSAVVYSELLSAYTAARRESPHHATAAANELRAFIDQEVTVAARHLADAQNEFPPGCRVMVRSSANCEDLEEMSGAGLYDSVANVCVDSVDELDSAIRCVWGSLWTPRAASSRASHGVPHKAAYMSVLLHRMVTSELSFVAFSVNPVNKNAEFCYMELAIGMGETLASAKGDGQPYRIRVGRSDGRVFIDSMASYSNALVPVPSKLTNGNGRLNGSYETLDPAQLSNDSFDTQGTNGGLVPRIVDYSQERMTNDAEFRDALATRIAKIVGMLEDEFGGPQDVEGAITGLADARTAADVNLYVVQTRPQIL